MRSSGVLTVGIGLASTVLGALMACSSGPAMDGGSVQPSVMDGEEGGACFSDGACNEGLECVADRCSAVNDADDEEGSGEGDLPSDNEPEQPGGEGENGDNGDGGGQNGEEETGKTLLIFHNNMGPMCLDALEWLEEARQEHGGLVVEEHLTTVPAEVDLLRELKAEYSASGGVSSRFEYLPIIFFEGCAFSGFDEDMEQALEALLLQRDEAK